MKKGIIIHSLLGGDMKYIVDLLAKKLNYEALNLEPIGEVKAKSFLSSFTKLTKKNPELKRHGLNMEQYDVFIFLTPVWSGSYVPTFETFFRNERSKLSRKKVALIACHEGKMGNVFEDFEKKLSNSNLIGELPLEKASKNKGTILMHLDNWIEEVF